MQVAPGITIGGKYTIEQPLARGGMGAVWVARHVKLGNPVAVKFLDAHLAAAPALVARFEREARAAANLDTPHVVKVHDYGVEDGTPYLVMELLRGEDLNTRLRARSRLSLGEAAKIVAQMGRALRRAHEVGLVHRDLKPANVFLARVEDEEVVKVLDFGIAKETWSRVDDATKTGEVFGSPHYMSPEQARALKTVDHRADVWACGVIAYRMITGRLPFPGEVLGEVLSSVLVDPFPPIVAVAPDLPAALDGFFSRALAKKKEERFSTVGELAEAFSGIAAGAPAARADSPLASTNPTAPTLDPASPAPDPPRLTPPHQPPGPTPTDTALPTQVYRKPPPTEHAPTPAGAARSALDKTGPTLGSASSTLSPPEPPRKRSSALWIVLAAAVGAGVVGALLFAKSSSSTAGPAATSGPAESGAVATPPSQPPSPPPAPAITETPAPAQPTSTASAAVPVGERPAAPVPSAQPTSTSKRAASPPPTATAASPSAGPTQKTPPKKQTPDWGL